MHQITYKKHGLTATSGFVNNIANYIPRSGSRILDIDGSTISRDHNISVTVLKGPHHSANSFDINLQAVMGNQISQVFPPAARFTDASVPDQNGKVYIVTGASAGVGKELAGLLYSRNATVYVAARSADRTNAAMKWIKEKYPDSKGAMHYLHLDLSNLDDVKQSAEIFLAKESRLDVLFNNAGVMTPPQGSKTEQGYELQLGTNCVAPFLFTKILTPLLIDTAKTEPRGSVRVVWTSSSAAHLASPEGGVDMLNLDYKTDKGAMAKYAVSKAGNVLHAREFTRRYNDHGIISMVCSLWLTLRQHLL